MDKKVYYIERIVEGNIANEDVGAWMHITGWKDACKQIKSWLGMEGTLRVQIEDAVQEGYMDHYDVQK